MTTESRIQLLEGEVRRFKRVALALAMLLLIGLCLVAASAQQQQKPQVVQGDFRILDAGGKLTTVLEQQGDVKVGRDLSVQGKVAIKDGNLVVKGKGILTELDNLKATIVANQTTSDKKLKDVKDEANASIDRLEGRIASLEKKMKKMTEGWFAIASELKGPNNSVTYYLYVKGGPDNDPTIHLHGGVTPTVRHKFRLMLID